MPFCVCGHTNGEHCPECWSIRYVVVQMYRSYHLCECTRCHTLFILPRHTVERHAALP